MTMILAGDVGGTKTYLGLFDRLPSRPRARVVGEFSTRDYDDLSGVVADFVAQHRDAKTKIEAASFGIAGPVNGSTAELTNVPWRADAWQIARSYEIETVTLLNDLEAMAYSVPILDN